METDEWEEFPEKLRIPIDLHNKDRDEDDDSRPHTDESRVPQIGITDLASGSRYTSSCIQIQITVEGFKQMGTMDEIKLVRQQSQAKMDRRMSQLKIFGKGTTLSRIQSVQSGSSATQMSVLNNYPNQSLNQLQRNFSVQSSSISNGNQLSGGSLQSNQNKTSSFGHLNRSSGLGKHMSMQDSKLAMYRFLAIPEHNSIASTVSNDDKLYGHDLQNNRNFSMHRDSFGRRNKNPSQASAIIEEAKINVQLSTISESVMSSDHPSTFNYQLKNQSSTSTKTPSQVNNLAGDTSPELKININNLTFNSGGLNLKQSAPRVTSNQQERVHHPPITLNLDDLVEDMELEESTNKPKAHFMRGNDDEDELDLILQQWNIKSEPMTAVPAAENQPLANKASIDLQRQESQFNFNRASTGKLMKGVSGMNLDVHLLDRAQRVASTMEFESQIPYTQQLEQRVAYLENANQMLMQNMMFMQAQLQSAFPNLFSGQLPYQPYLPSSGPGEPLMQVDEETSNLDTSQSVISKNRPVPSWPSEIGLIQPSQCSAYSRSQIPLHSQISSSANSHMHATLSSGGNPTLFLKTQASNFTQQLPKLLDRQMSNLDYSQTNKSHAKFEHSKTIPSPDTVYNSSNERRQPKMPDIIFAYADVMLKKQRDEYVPLKDNESLQPDLMYDLIMHKVRESQLKLTVKKTPLNKKILLKLLELPIKILFILCHGDIDDDKHDASWFCLEDEEDPSMIDYFNEARLKGLLSGKQIQCEMIVISACHSSRLADILKRHGAKAVIAINSMEKVLEKAAQQFNMIFLENLLEGKPANEAFETAVNNVRSMKREDVHICCCMHKHRPGCLWKELQRKDCNKAHEIHTAQCLCFEQAKVANTTEISHTGQCKYYINFVKELQKINLVQFIEYSEKLGFAQPLPKNLKPEDRFPMCCCSSDVPHNESQKIIYVGDLNQTFFSRDYQDHQLYPLREGDPIEQKPDLSKINLPVDSRPEYQGRKLEKSKIIQFLLSKNEKLLYIYGVQAAGKLGAVIKAVRFVAERNNLSFKDGAFLIDVEGCNTIAKIMLKIAEKAQLYQKDPTQSDIINWFKNEGTNSKNYLLVIKNVGLLKEEDVIRQFKNFIRKVITKTSSLKIIVISSNLNALPHTTSTSVQKLEFVKLTKKQLIDYLRQLLKAKRKLKYVNNIDLENHDLFKMEHLDIQVLPEIVQDISADRTLDQIAAQYEAQFQKLQADQATQENKIEIELVIQSFVCQKFLDSSRSKNMVYFTLFLIHAPDGLCKMEINHLSKLRPDLFTQEFLSQLEQASNADLQDEDEDLDGELDSEDFIGSIKKCLLHFFSIEKMTDIQEKKFKIHQLQRKALTFLQKLAPQRQQIEKYFGSFDYYENLSIEFFSRYAIKLHKKITKCKRNGEVDHNIVSMHLQQGIWSWEDDDEEDIADFNQEPIDLPIERYTSIESNFISILDHVKLIKYFDMNSEDDYDFERTCIINMTMAVPSILVDLERVDDAINLIEACSKIGLGGPRLWMHAKLDLMRASLLIKRNKDLVQRFEQIMGLLCNARQIFNDMNSYEGVAEAFYLQGLLLTNLDKQQQHQISYKLHSKYLPHTQSQKFEYLFDQEELDKPNFNTEKAFHRKESDFNCVCHHKQEDNRYPELDLSLDSKGETPGINESVDLCKGSNALHCLHQAIIFFEKNYDPEDGVGHFGLGKSLLMYIEIQIKEGLRKPNRKKYFQSHEERMLEHLRLAGQQFTALHMQKFIVYQKLLQSKIWHELEKLEDAKRLIDDAQTMARDKKIKDNSMLVDIQNQKNQILEDIRKNYSNLMTFAYSLPLVVEDQKGIIPVADTIKSTFDMRMCISHELEETGKLFQVNFDILSEDLLKSVAQSGTRVLHLSSDRIDEQNLCVERENGVAKFLSLKRIEQMLRPHTQLTGKLSMDVVCIAIPKSLKIGEVFSNLGVPHVLTFDLHLPVDQEQDPFKKHMIDPYRFNYIYGFCISFYSGLAREMTVREAFLSAKETMEDESKQLEHVWMLNADKQSVLQINDLGITPVLIGEEQDRHNNRLYSSDQVSNPSMMLKNGPIMDTSKQRGLLIGMKKPKTAYIGQQKNLHHVIKQLSDPVNPIVLIHVRGSKHVGKTRFIQEVAYHFHRRNKFTFKISYIDLAKINSRSAFKELLSNLEADCKALTENNDDDTSSKSEEDGRLHSSRQLSAQPNAPKKYDLLWVFDNAHALSDNHWSHFEPRIAKNCKYDCVKIIISSNYKTFKGRNFHSFTKVGGALKVGGEIKEKPLRMDEIRLTELTEFQAVDLLLSSCDREITKEELGLSPHDSKSIHEHLRLEGNIEKLKRLPKYILDFANLLKEYQYDDIQINVREKDKLQGVPNSHRMKQGQAIEIVPKNKNKRARNCNLQKKRETRQKNRVEVQTQISVNLSGTQSQWGSKAPTDEKIVEPVQSPVEITVTFPMDAQTSFELPTDDGTKRTGEPSLGKRMSHVSGQSAPKDEQLQPRVPLFSQFNMIMEMSSSEYESAENRSRTTSFNNETLNVRALRNAIIMQSPDLQRARPNQSRAVEDTKSHFMRPDMLTDADQRNRLFSGADADLAKELGLMESIHPDVSEQSVSADSYVVSNPKVAKQISQMASEQVLLPKNQRKPEPAKATRSREPTQQDQDDQEETKDPPKSEINQLEDIDFELDLLCLQQTAQNPSLVNKKAQSQMGFSRIQSLMFQKSDDLPKTDSFGRCRTEDLSLASESPTDMDNKQLRVGAKRKSLNTSGKKKVMNKAQPEPAKVPKLATTKSGKHVNKFAPKTKNKLRELRAEKRARAEPQDQDRVVEQSSEEESESSEERPPKEAVKGNNKTKKYSKYAEEQKQHNQRDLSD